ncbi:unnamed protein product (macronuclear) [Paramecium tetraurelia]|uniref:Uncharacterized protein n=1 Tax=Paramecium tetraurelia TaxID=5888 RepID=A0BAR8_PARTE|nr:uncharacterized protein GSPATT00000070001 [Paramecium tetraurelia]CAK55635.1 unnamed protein product [Paramecium tetraurelia]|eukprot:XP_001423033.1 hypothetical protein (macronuclear) [Paramecium tetraurelia strain d4-2]
MGCICKTQANQQTIKTKLVIVGLEQSGKTAIFEYIKRGNFFETQPTEGYNVDFNNKDYLIFDLAGRTPNLWQHYYQNADGIIFVIDSSKKENLQQVKEQLMKLNQDIELLNIGVLIMFTKSDLQLIDCEAFLEECEVLKNTEQEKVWQSCSSKTGEGINEGIQKLMLLIKKWNIRRQKI